MIANAIVSPNEFRKRPITPWMNATGTKITTSESVVALTARPTSAVAALAAAIGLHVLFFDEAEDVLQHHDRVVDNDADRQREREQRHRLSVKPIHSSSE